MHTCHEIAFGVWLQESAHTQTITEHSDFLNGSKSIFILDEAAVDIMTHKANMECCMAISGAN